MFEKFEFKFENFKYENKIKFCIFLSILGFKDKISNFFLSLFSLK